MCPRKCGGVLFDCASKIRLKGNDPRGTDRSKREYKARVRLKVPKR
jgi:hypothetical protein